MALLNSGCAWCLWMGVRANTMGGKNFLAVPFGAFLALLPSLVMLIWTIGWKYRTGFLGLIIPVVLIVWGIVVMAERLARKCFEDFLRDHKDDFESEKEREIDNKV